jgi:hypothetical protein
MNDVSKKSGKMVTVVCFNVLFQRLPRGDEETDKFLEQVIFGPRMEYRIS